MQLSHRIRPVFDDPNLVSAAGLVPTLRLEESAGLYRLLDEMLSVPAPSAVAKTAGLVGGMLAGADSIDDMDLLRHGGMRRLSVGVRAPRRGARSCARSPTVPPSTACREVPPVQQLDAVGGRLLAGLARRVPGLLAGGGTGGIAFVDVDDPSVRSRATPSREPGSGTPDSVA